jgi:hypothetical protein
LELCTEWFVIHLMMARGAETCCEVRKRCINKHNSCDCRSLSNRLVLYIFYVTPLHIIGINLLYFFALCYKPDGRGFESR